MGISLDGNWATLQVKNIVVVFIANVNELIFNQTNVLVHFLRIQ